MSVIKDIKSKFKGKHQPKFGALDILKYIGPGLLVTVGFIDPGNWASNIAAGSGFGYKLLWLVTLSTIMLIMLQHNVAHLGIATGLCLSEAATRYTKPWISRSILASGMLATISTSLAEVLGGAIALQMLFHLPIKIGSVLTATLVAYMLYSNTYRRLEKWIIGFVSIIGFSFIYELTLLDINWAEAGISLLKPSIPENSMLIIMSVLGAVVMPHNLFLHSEIIQSRQWNLEDKKIIKRQLDYELFDTMFSMVIGWAINVAIILVAVATFYEHNIAVFDLKQAKEMLSPLLGNAAGIVFAIALLFAGISSCLTAGMAGGSIFAGIYGEPYDIKDNHTRAGAAITILAAVILIFFINDPFKGLIISQMVLSIQLPFTIFLQIYLTSSKKVMGEYANKPHIVFFLFIIALLVTFLNILLLLSLF